MTRTRTMLTLASTLLVAQIAAAQMSGSGSHHGSSPSNGTGNPFSGMNRGLNGGEMNGDMGRGMGNSLTVGSDGVVFTLRSSTATRQSSTVELVAIRPSGTIAWTAKLDGGVNILELSRNLVLVGSGNMGSGDMGMNRGNESPTAPSRLIAFSMDSGSVQWQLSLDGVVIAIEPFAGGVYAMIARHDATRTGSGMHKSGNGASSMKRSVAAIDNAGIVLWKLDLD